MNQAEVDEQFREILEDEQDRMDTIDAMHWITDPVGHRHVGYAEFDSQYRKIVMLADDEWACDYCNGGMLVVNPVPIGLGAGRPMPVPSVGSYAICFDCMTKTLADVKLTVWPFKSCGCAACLVATAWIVKHTAREQMEAIRAVEGG